MGYCLTDCSDRRFDIKYKREDETCVKKKRVWKVNLPEEDYSSFTPCLYMSNGTFPIVNNEYIAIL